MVSAARTSCEINQCSYACESVYRFFVAGGPASWDTGCVVRTLNRIQYHPKRLRQASPDRDGPEVRNNRCNQEVWLVCDGLFARITLRLKSKAWDESRFDLAAAPRFQQSGPGRFSCEGGASE